jgi:hypothetical protein
VRPDALRHRTAWFPCHQATRSLSITPAPPPASTYAATTRAVGPSAPTVQAFARCTPTTRSPRTSSSGAFLAVNAARGHRSERRVGAHRLGARTITEGDLEPARPCGLPAGSGRLSRRCGRTVGHADIGHFCAVAEVTVASSAASPADDLAAQGALGCGRVVSADNGVELIFGDANRQEQVHVDAGAGQGLPSLR